jgi:hypothetical protein
MFGFTQALHVLFVRIECENDFATVIETFFHMFCVTLQQVTDAYKNFNRHPSTGIQVIGKVWHDKLNHVTTRLIRIYAFRFGL